MCPVNEFSGEDESPALASIARNAAAFAAQQKSNRNSGFQVPVGSKDINRVRAHPVDEKNAARGLGELTLAGSILSSSPR